MEEVRNALVELMKEFSEENWVEINVGKLSKNNRITLSIIEEIEDLPEGITSKQMNNFNLADKKFGLREKGIEIGEYVTTMGSIKPKSRTKKLVQARLVNGKPNGKSNQLAIQMPGLEKETPISIEAYLKLKNNPPTEDDVKVENGTHKWVITYENEGTEDEKEIRTLVEKK